LEWFGSVKLAPQLLDTRLWFLSRFRERGIRFRRLVPWLFNLPHPRHLWISRRGGSHRVIPHSEDHAHRVASTDMKRILFLTGIATLLSTSGCIFPGGDRGGREHARYEHHDAVIVGPPVVVVRPPEVIVR